MCTEASGAMVQTGNEMMGRRLRDHALTSTERVKGVEIVF